jgi:hypothetical protein
MVKPPKLKWKVVNQTRFGSHKPASFYRMPVQVKSSMTDPVPET